MILRNNDTPYSIIRYIMHRILSFYLYNVQAVQQLEKYDPDPPKTFALRKISAHGIFYVRTKQTLILVGRRNPITLAYGKKKISLQALHAKTLHGTKVTI